MHHRGMCGYSARQAGMNLELLRSGRIIGPDFPDASGRHERGGENGRRGARHGQSHRRALSVTYLFAFTPSWCVLLVIIYPLDDNGKVVISTAGGVSQKAHHGGRVPGHARQPFCVSRRLQHSPRLP